MNKKHILLISLIFWLPVVVFSYIAGEILERQPILFDTSILNWIHAHNSVFLDKFFLFITTLGNIEVILPLFLVICALLWKRRLRQSVTVLAGGFLGAAAANFILKLLFHRQRPTFWQSALHETGYSFPSGHAMASSALVFSLIVIAWNTRWRWWVTALGLSFMVLIGYSRLYLGVHFPTDIIAGWLASAAWVYTVSVMIIKRGSIAQKVKRAFKIDP